MENLLTDKVIDSMLERLTKRIDLIEKSYNQENANLHFENLPRIDSALFESLLSIGQEAWNIIQYNKTWKRAYWFYNFYQLINGSTPMNCSEEVINSISIDVLQRLVILLVDIEQVIVIDEFRGDISKRAYEALGNLLIAFDKNGDLQKLALKRA